MVENLVAVELAYINTRHPDFCKDAVVAGALISGNIEEGRGSGNPTAVAQRVIESSARRGGASKQQLQYGGGGSGAGSLINGGDGDKKQTGPDGTINASNWLNSILPAPKGGDPQEQQQQQTDQQQQRPESPAASVKSETTSSAGQVS